MAEKKDMRLGALRRFATAITVLNVLGHTVLGFEQSLATPVTAVLVAYAMEILLEVVESRRLGRKPRFLGPGSTFVDFLLSAHITGLAVGMLLYANERLLPVAFAAAVAIGSKYLFRVGTNGARRHFFNPSNLGITATLLAFPWVGIAQPYMFTENLSGAGDWVLPIIIVCSGSFLNTKFTRRIPLILAWLGGFVLQAAIRHFAFGNLFLPSLNPLTGMAFLLFTFYMVTDPATTPVTRRGQIAFGLSMAAAYGTLMAFHIVFGLFFGLSAVCAGRGVLLYLKALAAQRAEARVKVAFPAEA
ncbi:MAG: enediyne biosynthesis protein [Acidobacteriota bacterium]|jgi:Na+-translocating ferredoxin:NAD+ oxidoreductase RnfD subunit|nr:enediyne biosynthesis protein [Acidobacteriota bacterium]